MWPCRRGTIEGGTSFAKITKTAAECNFAADTFYKVSLTYTPDDADAALDGQPIQIRVMAGDPLGTERTFACVDDVHLKLGELKAGPDMAAWDGKAVPMGASYGSVTPASILWTADSAADPNFSVTISDSADANPTLTVTKLNALAPDVITVKMTVLADGEEDSMTVNVYDTPCQAAIAAGLNTPGDLDNDCDTDIDDLAVMATSWLVNTEVTSWEPE